MAESRMTSRATVRRKTGVTTQDEGTGEEVPVWAVVHADLSFRLGGSNQGNAGTRTVRIGDEEFQQAVRVGHFPANTTGLADSDLIEVTAGENAGRVLRIVEASWQDQATARRVPVVEVDRPGEW
jgi:hypothetical protein